MGHESIFVRRIFGGEGDHPIRFRVQLVLEEDRKVALYHVPQDDARSIGIGCCFFRIVISFYNFSKFSIDYLLRQ